jgi:hypothetical protein
MNQTLPFGLNAAISLPVAPRDQDPRGATSAVVRKTNRRCRPRPAVRSRPLRSAGQEPDGEEDSPLEVGGEAGQERLGSTPRDDVENMSVDQ